ncbi:hypothetical protein Glove_311g15 [Diversispora epigaea]|uniref:SAM domain-containing protein n=1 Tax=Diversispora epigaea TaxID=1348612 RepID=A0A397HSD4_9GLOM|nr:hypothetical protein Glove_311g15 [Diversispora epigaea]
MSTSFSTFAETRKGVSTLADLVNEMDTDQLIEFLWNEHLGLSRKNLNILKDQKVSGSDFLLLTEKKLLEPPYKLSGEQSSRIANYINNLKEHNSNLFTEGRFTVGNLEQTGTFNHQRNSFYFNQLYIDHGHLISTVLNGRRMGSNPVIVGSRPPPNDSLWNQDYNVTIKDRKPNMELAVSAVTIFLNKGPGIFVLIAGCGGYEPLIFRAVKHNWKIEIWFWSSGISSCFARKSFFYSLDNLYQYFTYVYGQDPTRKSYTLEITGEAVGKWENDEIMNCFVSSQLFARWYRKDRLTINYYFDNKVNLGKAINWMKSNHPEIDKMAVI